MVYMLYVNGSVVVIVFLGMVYMLSVTWFSGRYSVSRYVIYVVCDVVQWSV